MKLLIVRHAESQGNASGNYSTADADSLSREGNAQALSLVDSLLPWTFDKLLVSPFDRTIETISPYLQMTRQRAEIWPEIAEACWQAEREEPSASWNAQPAVLPDPLAHLFAYRNDEPSKPAYPESFGEGLRRVHDAVEQIQKMADRSITSALMVSHGHPGAFYHDVQFCPIM